MVVWFAVFLAFVNAQGARADVVLVVGGQSNLFLNPAVLASLGITISGTAGTVPAAPGFTVAYPISARLRLVPGTNGDWPLAKSSSVTVSVHHRQVVGQSG
jgi:hypothetical protein